MPNGCKEGVLMTECFVCHRKTIDAAGELWFKHLNAEGKVVVVTCPRQDAQHVQIGSDLRREIQGEDMVVVLEAFMPEKTR